LFREGIRSIVSEKSDKIGAKIRQAELDKNNIMLIVGDQEELDKTVSYRRRFDGNMGVRSFKVLKNELINEIKTRSLSHSKKK
jgi:threonyl-tRNA synthetase